MIILNVINTYFIYLKKQVIITSTLGETLLNTR